MALDSFSRFSHSSNYLPVSCASSSDACSAKETSPHGCFSFIRKIFWRAPEKGVETPKLERVSPLIETVSPSPAKTSSNGDLLRRHFGDVSCIPVKLETEEPYEKESSIDDSSVSDDDSLFDRYLPTPQPVAAAIHSDAEKKLRKYFSDEQMLKLNNALQLLAVHKLAAKTLDQPQLVRCRSVLSPRSLLVLPSGDVYLLLNRKRAGDRLLGKGTFKNVYRAINLNTGESAAYISAQIRPDYLYQKEACHKAEYLSYEQNQPVACHSVPNSYYVKHVKYSPDEQVSCYLVQRMKGDLWHGTRKGHIDLSQKDVRISIALQMTALLSQYHEQNRLHRDIKPDNFLYAMIEGRPLIKLSDFGLSVPIGAAAVNGMGTSMYRAPEDCPRDARNGSFKSDSFQLGMTLAILFKDHLNFDDAATEEFREYLRNVTELTKNWHPTEIAAMTAVQAKWIHKQLTQEQWLTPPADERSLEYVIYKLLQINPEERWTPAQAAQALREIVSPT